MTTWDIYYATLVGMTLHPGYTREGTHKPTLRECAKLADQMMEYSRCETSKTSEKNIKAAG